MSNSELIQKKSNKYDVLAPNDHDHESCTPVYSVTSPKTAHKYYGIINKGNKCDANIILQCLQVFPILWSPND